MLVNLRPMFNKTEKFGKKKLFVCKNIQSKSNNVDVTKSAAVGQHFPCIISALKKYRISTINKFVYFLKININLSYFCWWPRQLLFVLILYYIYV